MASATEGLSLSLVSQITSARSGAAISFLRSEQEQDSSLANLLEGASKNAASLANVGPGVGENVNKKA
jgi:hypothetical protein